MLLRTNRSVPRSDDFTIRAAELLLEPFGIRRTDELVLSGAVRLRENFRGERPYSGAPTRRGPESPRPRATRAGEAEIA